tara:strand:+ start:2199 stop:2402 length:204 start_codon:yes stop_codon:yes gene_type:complete
MRKLIEKFLFSNSVIRDINRVLFLVNIVMVGVSLLLGLWYHVGMHLTLAVFGLFLHLVFRKISSKEK